MHLPRLSSLIFLASMASACSAAPAPSGGPTHGVPGAAAESAAGRFLERTHAGAAGGRAYRLYLPAGFDGRRDLPLVVLLHGCAQDAADIAAGTRMNEFADRHGFLVAYPEQPAAANPQRCWGWYDPAHRRRASGEAALIAGITREVMAGHPVDPARVFVAGISAGGAMALVQAATYPELYAAVGVHSGIMFGQADDLQQALAAMQGRGRHPAVLADAVVAAMGERARALPAILFQGAADPLVATENAHTIADGWLRVLSRLGAQVGAAPREQTLQVNGRTVRRTDFPAADGRVLVERWIVDGLGHAWSGGSVDGTFADPLGPDATREIVRFFLEVPFP
jgi:poly(hydroxyalkanoate) depolymerase family esterase